MTTPSEEIQKEIIFTRKRIVEADKEIYNLIILRIFFYRHLLAETEKWQAAQLAEAQQAQAVEAVGE